MNHPIWYMAVHYLLSFIGIKELVLGSSGNKGRRRFKIRKSFKEESATTFAVDGRQASQGFKKRLSLRLFRRVFPLCLSFHPQPYFILG